MACQPHRVRVSRMPAVTSHPPSCRSVPTEWRHIDLDVPLTLPSASRANITGTLQSAAESAERPTFRPGSGAIDGFVWCRAMLQPPACATYEMGDASPAYTTAPATADLLLNPSTAVDRTNGWHWLSSPLVCQLQDRRATIEDMNLAMSSARTVLGVAD